MNALQTAAVAAVVCLLGQGARAEQQVLHGVECERSPSDNRILLTSPFTAEISSRIEYPFEILIFRPGRFDGIWDHGTCDVRLNLRDSVAQPTPTTPEQANADFKAKEQKVCHDPGLLDTVRQGLAQHKFWTDISQMDFSNIHLQAWEKNGGNERWKCTATVRSVGTVVYGEQIINGNSVALYKILPYGHPYSPSDRFFDD